MSKLNFRFRAFLAALIRLVMFLAIVVFAAVVLSGLVVIGVPLVLLAGLLFGLTAIGQRVDPRWRRPF